MTLAMINEHKQVPSSVKNRKQPQNDEKDSPLHFLCHVQRRMSTVAMPGPLMLLLLLLDSQIIAFNSIPEGWKYEVVYPRKLRTQHKRDTQSKYPAQVHYGLEVNGKPIVLQLEKTEDLLSGNYTETQYLDDVTPVTTIPEELDHCYYQGHVKDDSSSLVSLSACQGLSGLIVTQEQKLLIEPLNLTENGAHAVYAYQDQDAPKTCRVNHTMYNESIITKTASFSTNSEVQEYLKARKYIELYIVVDNSMFIKYNGNEEEIRTRIFKMLNYMNTVYKLLNIFVALTGMEIWKTNDHFQVVTDMELTLNRFTDWRKDNLLPRKPHDNAQFITNVDFDGTNVGYAWTKEMCSDRRSAGVSQDHSADPFLVGATMAHEMGHNLGMDHDEGICKCHLKTCIMAPSLSNVLPDTFSSCSHQSYQNFIEQQMPLCIKNKPRKGDIYNDPVCGNKFTEAGEECDCGMVEECANNCCDATTCKFRPGTQCAEGECCTDCQLKTAGSVCRPVKDECDLSEMCDGKSPMCPSDRFQVNGVSCMSGKGYCYNGNCPTLQGQCRRYWGPESVVADDSCCDTMKRGFCQKTGAGDHCTSRDVKCRVLFCSGGYSQPIAGSGYCTMSNRNSDCKTLNPAVLIEDGTWCRNNSMCNKGRCISVADVQKCSAKCPGHGVCDHEQQCQCQEGWVPPNCDSRAQLGSGYIALIVIILLIIVAAVLFIVYKKKFQRRTHCRRSVECQSDLANPIFNIQNGTRELHNPHSTTPLARISEVSLLCWRGRFFTVVINDRVMPQKPETGSIRGVLSTFLCPQHSLRSLKYHQGFLHSHRTSLKSLKFTMKAHPKCHVRDQLLHLHLDHRNPSLHRSGWGKGRMRGDQRAGCLPRELRS
ncbi:PREDICTED: zinc metalloproteinase-disintegrin-like ACLD [Nanorana parkeri]|uniref:zinc metalloproteinase-disintegrin-like ACLD n=1 Tax=Nanorana parkeri TaxID=125878 RepID=UPI0008548118|nr:PREDICTED: zinc metalloproteinase-disintegrin-like ACLD [Nanorana parkeri]